MKTKYIIMVLALAMGLASCGKSSEDKIDYLPCQTGAGKAWGLIDAKGNVILDGRFENEPSAVRDGMMTVQNGSYYQLYRIDGKEAILVADSLTAAGVPAFGRVPVCRPDGTLEVLDKNGQSVFVFDQVEGLQVSATAPQYERGLLKVETITLLGTHHLALVDTKGNTVLPPHYSKILVLDDDLAWVLQETATNNENDSTEQVRRTSYFINMKGQLQGDMPKSLDSEEKVLAQYGKKSEGVRNENGWTITYVEGFGYVGSKDLQMAVMNDKDWSVKGQTVSHISLPREAKEHISNDIYTYDNLTKAVLNQLQIGLQSRGLVIPMAAPFITSILETDANNYNTYATFQSYAWTDGDVRCEAKATFDTVIVRPHIVQTEDAHENMFGEAVVMKKMKEEGYEYNPESDLVSIDLDCMVDSTLTQIVYERLITLMDQQYKKREALYVDREQVISVKMSKGKISFHIVRDPKVIAAEEEARKKAMQAAIDSAIAAQTDTTVKTEVKTDVKNDTIIAE